MTDRAAGKTNGTTAGAKADEASTPAAPAARTEAAAGAAEPAAPASAASAERGGAPAPDRVVVKDKRRIDPSGAPKTSSPKVEEEAAAQDKAPAGAEPDGVVTESVGVVATEPAAEQVAGEGDEAEVEAPAAPPSLGAELEALRAELDERTKDLQRVTAEYANYRKRVDRDRALVVEQATGVVLASLLPVLDDLDRARDHGDLVGPFGAVAEKLIAALGKFGLSAFGETGDPFDPTRHEAVTHQTSSEVTEPTCVDVMRRGYLLGERLLRPALVAVADPE